MALTLTIQNGATQTVATLQGHLANLRLPLTETALLARSSVLQNFVEGGRPQRWAPLKWPRKRGSLGAAVPLTDNGILRASIRSNVVGNSVILSTGTHVPYAAIHHYGGTVHLPAITAAPGRALRWVARDGAVIYRRRVRARTVTIPARPYMLLQEADVTAIVAIFTRYLTAGVEKG